MVRAGERERGGEDLLQLLLPREAALRLTHLQPPSEVLCAQVARPANEEARRRCRRREEEVKRTREEEVRRGDARGAARWCERRREGTAPQGERAEEEGGARGMMNNALVRAGRALVVVDCEPQRLHRLLAQLCTARRV